MEIECKIISNYSKRTKLQGAVLCTVHTELPQMFCTLNIKVSPAEGHSSAHWGAESPRKDFLWNSRNFPADIRSQWAEKKGQMQTFLKHLQNVGHTHWHLPEYCLTHQSSLFSHYLLNIFVIPKSILMAFHSHSRASTEQWTIWATSAHVSSWDRTRLALPPSFSSRAVNNHPFYALFCSFVCVISLFKTAWGLVLKCYLRFYAQEDRVGLVEKVGVLDELHSGITYSAAGHEFSVMNQQYI